MNSQKVKTPLGGSGFAACGGDAAREADIASILIIGSGLYGRLLCSVELGRRLRATGHVVAYASPERSRSVVAAAGFRFFPIPEVELGVFTRRVPRLAGGVTTRSWAERERRLSAGLLTLGLSDFAELLKTEDPDLVLADFELHGQIMVAVSQGYPTALYTSMVAGSPGWQSPPLHTGVVPGRGFAGSRVGVALTWIRYWTWKGRFLLRAGLGSWGGDLASILWRHAKSTGFDRRLIAPWRWQLPWSYRLPLLVLQAREFDLPRRTPDNVHYLGPMIARGPPGDRKNSQCSQFLDAFQAERGDTEQKLIYAAFGTIVTPDSALVRNLWTAVGRNPAWRLLFVAGRYGKGEFPAERPANVEVVDWAPQLEALSTADLAITHGGTGSIVEAVDTLTPTLAYPRPKMDHPGNAARVAFHGIGRVGRLDDDAETIEGDIRETLESFAIRDAVARMKQAFDAYAEAQTAERVIDTLLAGPLGAS